MSLDPISIATKGYIGPDGCMSSLGIASAGYIFIPSQIVFASYLNVDSYGQEIMINFGVDISGSINHKVSLQSQDSLAITIDSGIIVGDETVNYNGQRFRANRYIRFTLPEGVIKSEGSWRFQASADIDDERIISPHQYNTVLP